MIELLNLCFPIIIFITMMYLFIFLWVSVIIWLYKTNKSFLILSHSTLAMAFMIWVFPVLIK